MKRVIADRRVVPDVVAAPQRHVAAQAHERLYGVVLEDETIVAVRILRQERAAAAHVADEPVAERPGLVVLRCPHLIHLRVAHGHEHLVGRWWIDQRDLVERHQRETLKGIAVPVCRVHGEGNDRMVRIRREVEMGEPRDVPGPENDDVRHDSYFLTMTVNSNSG